MKKAITALALAMASTAAPAADLLLYGLSHHFGGHVVTSAPSREYNERNYGIGVEVDGWGAGVYRDSYGEKAKMAYYAAYTGDKEGLQLGVRAGWLDGSGYRGPVAMPVIRYKYVEGALLPAPPKHRDGVVAVWLRLPL